MSKKRIAVLVSGGGTNLQALIDAQKSGVLHSGSIELVISSKPGVFALERAAAAGIKSVVVNYDDYGERKAFSDAVLRQILDEKIDLVVLAGFLRVFSEEFCDALEGRIINVHPSLIPAFCGDGFYGMRVHRAVLEYGAKVSGATVHFVNKVTDGGKIIMQKAVDVLDDDTPESLQRRIMIECEQVILPLSVEKICANI